MSILKEIEIFKLLQESNPWWNSGTIDKDLVPPFKRNEYKRVRGIFFHEIRRFPVLSGPRRVGKSTIMFQIIDELLHQGVKPTQVLFYTLDDYPNDEVGVKDAVRVFRKFVYSGDDFYLFIDEAQKDKTWKTFAKQLFDLNKKARVMVSGSSSVEIENNSDESGSARFLTIKIPTFSFYEFCELYDKRADIPDVDVFKMHLLPMEEQTSIYLKISSLYKEFIRYLKIGGFPEYAKSEQYGFVSKLIRDQVIVKAIRQDIPTSYKIRDVETLSSLFTYFCYHSSDIIAVETLARTLGMDRTTCNLYISALEKANLIYVSEQLDLGGKKALKSRRKVYVSDYGIRCAVTRNNDVEVDDNEFGFAVETVALKHTKDYFTSIDNELYNVGYSKGEGDKEIDIVIQEQGKDIQYVEAKYRRKSPIKDKDAIVVYGLKDVPGYVVTKDVNDYGLQLRGNTSLYRIPSIAYFYLLGKGKQ